MKLSLQAAFDLNTSLLSSHAFSNKKTYSNVYPITLQCIGQRVSLLISAPERCVTMDHSFKGHMHRNDKHISF